MSDDVRRSGKTDVIDGQSQLGRDFQLARHQEPGTMSTRVAGARPRHKWRPDKALREGLRHARASWEHMPDDAVHEWFMMNGATECCMYRHPIDFNTRSSVGAKLKKIFASREKFLKELGFVRPRQVRSCVCVWSLSRFDTPTHGVAD